MKQIILDGRDRIRGWRYVRRNLSVDHQFVARTGKIAAIVGPRRAGKSTYLAQIAHDVDASPEAVAFVDFSELPLRDFRDDDFELLYVAQKELAPGVRPVFLLDEIQEVSGFEAGLAFLRGKGASVYLAGSTMQIAAGELSSILRGKVLAYRLHPLSFAEFLRFRGDDGLDPRRTEDAARLYSHLDAYEWWGGFPEVVQADRADTRRNLIDSYIDVMLLRDVVERHSLKNLGAARRILTRLLSSYTREISISRWHNELRSMGMQIARDTVYEYVSHFEESLFFLFASNSLAGATARRKVYLADNGLVEHTRPAEPDSGKRFENHLYLWAAVHGEQPGFAKTERGEIDLVIRNRAIQVCLSINGANAERELGPLRAFRSRGGQSFLVVRDSRGLDRDLTGDMPVVDMRDLLRAPSMLSE